MSDRQQRLQQRIGSELQDFREQCKTLQLATLTATNTTPHVSYAPFVFIDRDYYILVSDIAQHGQNLKHQPLVSIMLIEDEATARSLYARRRLTFDSHAKVVAKDSDDGIKAIQQLRHRFGEIIDNLSQFADFNLYRLTPESGRYVKGFGQAFEISGEDTVDVVHLQEGHKKQ